MKTFLLIVVMFGLTFLGNISQSLAQVQPIYVALGGGAHGTLNRPTSGTYSHIGINSCSSYRKSVRILHELGEQRILSILS